MEGCSGATGAIRLAITISFVGAIRLAITICVIRLTITIFVGVLVG